MKTWLVVAGIEMGLVLGAASTCAQIRGAYKDAQAPAMQQDDDLTGAPSAKGVSATHKASQKLST